MGAISSSVPIVSTGTWSITPRESTDGQIWDRSSNAEENPMTFYTQMYLPDGSWMPTKTAYDPCPAGWRVPEGGKNGVWAKALGISNSVLLTFPFDSENFGINFTGIFSDVESVWYPTTCSRGYSNGAFSDVHWAGSYWSCSPSDRFYENAQNLYFNGNGNVSPSDYYDTERAYGLPVRCLKETN